MTVADATTTPPRTAAALTALAERRARALLGGGPQAAARQHARGRLTARERVELLLDPGSFAETDALVRHDCPALGASRPYGDGVVTGHGTVDGRPVALFAHDATVFGGSMGEAFGRKVLKVMDHALRTGCPVVGLNDSGGARIQEAVVSLAHYAELAHRNVRASGVIPQISLLLGSCAGGAAYSPALTDFTVMTEGTSRMFVTGPDVIRSVTGEDTTAEALGGARANATVNGNAHYLAADEADAFDFTRVLLSYLPANNCEPPPVYAGPGADDAADDPVLDTLAPASPRAAYDMRHIVRRVVDDGELLEIHERFAPNVVCAFARAAGATVGVVANQPAHAAGALDIDASEKAARFVRFCDAFGIPLLTFVDVPGYLSGAEQERDGIVRRGAKLLYAYSEATVPQVTVVTGKAYGGGYAVMGSKHLGADVNLAWPTARIAVMGARGAVEILHRRALREAADPDALRRELADAYEREVATPYTAAERGYLDAVIAPRETRRYVLRALRALREKSRPAPERRHGNIPL
ncbi:MULTISPECIES: acyl-CoA carboxylase subunit beta [Streptomycetaceae]|uniref:Carboxyl transferase n=1 Tax=Streptantibioticus cattleyicolor (strain ATCC 35852 / DSM 46488 / JCM 4925 / NBRC 14057 / NRRL 8057) TaxID=1003195 RepID=F8K1W0_STREN|nr:MULTISPECIES: acyl-CoA carboxylase subunit beta [Streptomycetaceae]AEW92434.1 carboxyl transferase [Streptantibioticus cattleyicolor NRRL 8057 = DSM 46488]MYS57242.1 methylmalonyl-CoA carboxyltransferase [Streptomyces sp. SID5468]CCB72799.1 putative acyl-CoA carboxylase [Streptantibioticus cattleyicolor NRRL 8057 = DSM 46488]